MALTMAALLDVEFQRCGYGGYGASLDFQRAFDDISVGLIGKAFALVVLRSLRPWLAAVANQMSQLKR